MDAILNAYFAGFLMAIVFGVISPNVNKINVMIPVIIAIFAAKFVNPNELNVSIKKAVAIAEAPILEILFPINIPVIKFRGFSNIFSSFSAPLTFSSFKLRNLILFTAVNAVSALEKNADKKMNPIKIINFIIKMGSKVTPLQCP